MRKNGLVPNMERALAYLDPSPNGIFAASLAGLFAARQQTLITVLKAKNADFPGRADVAQVLSEQWRWCSRRCLPRVGRQAGSSIFDVLRSACPDQNDLAMAMVRSRSPGRGYDLVFIGIEHAISASADQFDNRLPAAGRDVRRTLAITCSTEKTSCRESGAPLRRYWYPQEERQLPDWPLRMALLRLQAPANNARSRSCMFSTHRTIRHCSVAEPAVRVCPFWPRPAAWGSATICAQGDLRHAAAEAAIERAARAGRYDLVVVGTSLREGRRNSLDHTCHALLRNLDSPTLLWSPCENYEVHRVPQRRSTCSRWIGGT